MKAPMWGVSDAADFDKYTWTFKMSGDYRVAAGAYAIIPEKEYKALVAALLAAPPQPEPTNTRTVPVEHPTYGSLRKLVNEIDKQMQAGYWPRIGQMGALYWFADRIAAAPPQSEPADHRAALDAIINAGSLGQARRIAMQALGEGGKNAAPERDAKPGIAEAGSRAAAPDGILCQARGDWGCNHTGTCASVNNAPPDAPAVAVPSAEAYAMDCEGYAAPAAPTRSGPNTDVVCHAPGYKCLGCAHYYGKAPVCEYAPASTLPLSAEQINEQLKGFHSGFYYDVLRQAMRAIELEQRVKEAESNAAFDSRLAAERGEKLAEAMQTARDKLLGWEQAEARCKELERHLKAQAEWGLNQFDRAEKAVAAAAEKDREIALLLAESVLEKERTKTAEAELAELKARVKP